MSSTVGPDRDGAPPSSTSEPDQVRTPPSKKKKKSDSPIWVELGSAEKKKMMEAIRADGCFLLNHATLCKKGCVPGNGLCAGSSLAQVFFGQCEYAHVEMVRRAGESTLSALIEELGACADEDGFRDFLAKTNGVAACFALVGASLLNRFQWDYPNDGPAVHLQRSWPDRFGCDGDRAWRDVFADAACAAKSTVESSFYAHIDSLVIVLKAYRELFQRQKGAFDSLAHDLWYNDFMVACAAFGLCIGPDLERHVVLILQDDADNLQFMGSLTGTLVEKVRLILNLRRKANGRCYDMIRTSAITDGAKREKVLDIVISISHDLGIRLCIVLYERLGVHFSPVESLGEINARLEITRWLATYREYTGETQRRYHQ